MMSAYRPNVAVILEDTDTAEILVCERADHPGCWQFPQGGVDEGEDLLGALFREVEEEIGLDRSAYTVEACRTGYRYDFPDGQLRDGIYRGQEQTYFLCRFLGGREDIDLELEDPEFRAARWIRPGEFQLDWVPPFKREVFRRVFRDFFDRDLDGDDA